MKGCKPWEAAAQEALEEAGIVGQPRKKPLGNFLYFKRRAAHFDLCQVEVYVLNFVKQLATWREKGQREARWFTLEEAVERVEEPGLVALLQNFAVTGVRVAKSKVKSKKAGAKVAEEKA